MENEQDALSSSQYVAATVLVSQDDTSFFSLYRHATKKPCLVIPHLWSLPGQLFWPRPTTMVWMAPQLSHPRTAGSPLLSWTRFIRRRGKHRPRAGLHQHTSDISSHVSDRARDTNMPADHWGVSLMTSTKCYDYNFISLKERNWLQHLVALMRRS